MNCTNCPRHITNQPEIAALLSPEHRDALQLALCADREGGSCPGDPWESGEL